MGNCNMITMQPAISIQVSMRLLLELAKKKTLKVNITEFFFITKSE